jgi:hypothetical protein
MNIDKNNIRFDYRGYTISIVANGTYREVAIWKGDGDIMVIGKYDDDPNSLIAMIELAKSKVNTHNRLEEDKRIDTMWDLCYRDDYLN